MENNKLPILRECCCGCSLKTGSMIIGFISLVSSSILTSVAVYSLVNDKFLVVSDDADLDYVLQVFIITVRVIQIFCSILLITGTHKDKAVLVAPWLVVALVIVVLEGGSLVVMYSHLVVGDYNKRLFSMTTHVGVTIYFIFVVFSYHREVKSKESSSNKA